MSTAQFIASRLLREALQAAIANDADEDSEATFFPTSAPTTEDDFQRRNWMMYNIAMVKKPLLTGVGVLIGLVMIAYGFMHLLERLNVCERVDMQRAEREKSDGLWDIQESERRKILLFLFRKQAKTVFRFKREDGGKAVVDETTTQPLSQQSTMPEDANRDICVSLNQESTGTTINGRQASCCISGSVIQKSAIPPDTTDCGQVSTADESENVTTSEKNVSHPLNGSSTKASPDAVLYDQEQKETVASILVAPNEELDSSTNAADDENDNNLSYEEVISEPSTDSLEYVCSICLSDYEDGCKVMTGTACQHVFHMECAMEWLQKHSHCPYCREPMMSRDEFRLAAMQVLGLVRCRELGILADPSTDTEGGESDSPV
jgi:hypothetical protein